MRPRPRARAEWRGIERVGLVVVGGALLISLEAHLRAGMANLLSEASTRRRVRGARCPTRMLGRGRAYELVLD